MWPRQMQIRSSATRRAALALFIIDISLVLCKVVHLLVSFTMLSPELWWSMEMHKSPSKGLCGLHLLKSNSGYFGMCSINLPFPLHSASNKLDLSFPQETSVLFFYLLIFLLPFCSIGTNTAHDVDHHLLHAIFILLYCFILKTEKCFFAQSIFQLLHCSLTLCN